MHRQTNWRISQSPKEGDLSTYTAIGDGLGRGSIFPLRRRCPGRDLQTKHTSKPNRKVPNKCVKSILRLLPFDTNGTSIYVSRTTFCTGHASPSTGHASWNSDPKRGVANSNARLIGLRCRRWTRTPQEPEPGIAVKNAAGGSFTVSPNEEHKCSAVRGGACERRSVRRGINLAFGTEAGALKTECSKMNTFNQQSSWWCPTSGHVPAVKLSRQTGCDPSKAEMKRGRQMEGERPA